jgi:hypothetical protein
MIVQASCAICGHRGGPEEIKEYLGGVDMCRSCAAKGEIHVLEEGNRADLAIIGWLQEQINKRVAEIERLKKDIRP